ncbi:MAG: hypothetical protein R3D28_15285 [Geminicoccaceae bacterium]
MGGVAVHDWFAAHGLVDAVELTIEPLTFAAGLRSSPGHGVWRPVAR